jgi:hypothetical protein
VVLEESPGVMNVTWLSDEALFHLDGYRNSNNVVLQLHKVHDLRGHCIGHDLV